MKAEEVLKQLAQDYDRANVSHPVWQLVAYTLLQAGWTRCEKCNAWTEPGQVSGYPCGCINPFPNE